METSDSDYFESADEDFHPWEESDKKKIKTEHNLHTQSENKLHSFHVQKNEQSTKCVPEINNTATQQETQLTDLLNQNLKLESEDNVYKEGNIKNVMSQISLADDTKANVKQENVKLSAERKDQTLVIRSNDMKKEIAGPAKNNDQILKNDEIDHLNKKVLVKDVGGNETIESNNEVDNMWDEDDWMVDHERDKENILHNAGKNTAKTKKTTQNTSDTMEENMWENDEWEPIDEEEEINREKSNSIKQNDIVDPHVWTRWSDWGVSSVLSTASHSVSTLTSSVSQGISTVLETSIGVPQPEELARIIRTEEQKKPDQNKNNLDEEYQNKNLLGFGFGNIGNLVSGVSKLVESTSTKVISGGLDTLETIGKKTMEVLQEGDPGLKKKRAFLKLNAEKPILSQVLREAKEKVEQESAKLEKPIAKKINYETLFDDHQGLVHLEALEILSKQCEIKLQTLIESCTGESLTEIQETISQVKELCELPDEDDQEQMSSEDIKERLKCVVDEISIRITYDRFISIWEDTELWLNNLGPGVCDEVELHQRAIDTLARLTAVVVEQFHKAGELLFIKDHHNTADEADGLVQLTTVLTSVISIVAGRFSEILNEKASSGSNEEEINSLITNVFFEAANSSSYIRDAFQLLVPVLQIGSVNV